MEGVKKLFDSSTFVLAVVAFAAHYVSGGLIPLDLLLGAVGIYGVKESAKYVGEGLSKRADVAKPDGVDK